MCSYASPSLKECGLRTMFMTLGNTEVGPKAALLPNHCSVNSLCPQISSVETGIKSVPRWESSLCGSWRPSRKGRAPMGDVLSCSWTMVMVDLFLAPHRFPPVVLRVWEGHFFLPSLPTCHPCWGSPLRAGSQHRRSSPHTSPVCILGFSGSKVEEGLGMGQHLEKSQAFSLFTFYNL